MPAIRPAMGGAPDAAAMPRHKGKATRKTTMDAGRSCFQKLKRFERSISKCREKDIQ
jgi:hypothetical protein